MLRTVYSWFGIVRFDTQATADIKFVRNYTKVEETIQNNLPDPKQGFGKSKTGSNIFHVLEQFFSNTEASVCGSIILVLLKRYPDETDISRLVSLIRSHHATFHVVISATPSGESQPRTMYYVASKTNGMGMVEYDEHFYDAVNHFSFIFSTPWPIYALNLQVSGNGGLYLPNFFPSVSHEYYIAITYQDHVPIKSLKSINLKWYNIALSHHGSFLVDSKDVSRVEFGGNYAGGFDDFSDVNYTMQLHYDYAGQDLQNLQIRIYNFRAPSNWWPYSD